jgi:hypothetical protein
MKTLQEAKDEVAIMYKYGIVGKHLWEDWNEMEQYLKFKGLQDWTISRMHEAAELYKDSAVASLKEENEKLREMIQKFIDDSASSDVNVFRSNLETAKQLLNP